MDRAADVSLKFQRAHEHIAQLSEGITGFVATEPFAVEESEEQGDLVYRVRVREAPPRELSLALGDAVHDARSALDYLAWQLVRAGGSTPCTSTYFPITRDEQTFMAKYRSDLRGATKEALDAVRQLRPFGGGDDRFWRLHKLDIADKHHLLLAVGAAHQSVSTSIAPPGWPGDPFTLPLVPADRQYPLTDGSEVFRVMAAAREPGAPSGQPSFTFEIAFSDDTQVVKGEPILPTISDLITGIEETVVPLKEFLQ
ncbi:hypothetical protein [Streptacidiphilus fuscans]|uniref:Uncharacterized protein n=1 Tax=Streptacidiphilus fuscans TaxID=2789292 RepID=A0A931B602_9ACTN|nr:hypothetical protein [Streptacidiphilus fuscans]MBF9071729.1 hypothetical protein [Streptacidiphilus fuscans]